jgi:hypothetical protein
MRFMSQENHSNRPDPVESSSEHAQRTTASVGENLEGLLAGLLRIVSRYVWTVALLSLMPTRASQSICPQPPDYRHLLRPYTLLFIGCLLYSFLLGAVSHITSSDITEMVVKITKDSFGREFSFNALLVRSLPLVIVASLCATLAGMLTRTGGDTVRTLMVYLYGLQGSLLFFFVLAMDVLRDAFQRMLSSDDYIILAFLLLILALSIQGYRMFRHRVNAIHEQPKVRLLLLLGFPLFFLVPIPLAGYLVVATNLMPDEVEQEVRERRVAPVRIIEARATTIGRNNVYVALSALIQNQSGFPFILSRDGIDMELYFVSGDELNNVGRPDERTYPDLDLFDRFRLYFGSVHAEITAPDLDPSVLGPEAATIVEITIKVEGTAAWFEARQRYKQGQPIRQAPESSERPWDELAQGRSLFIGLVVQDVTSGQILRSEYFRVK